MMEYEEAAQRSINKMQKQHSREVKQYKKMIGKDPNFKIVFSQDLIMLRNRINKLISVGKYDEANRLKEKADQLEKVREWGMISYRWSTVRQLLSPKWILTKNFKN